MTLSLRAISSSILRHPLVIVAALAVTGIAAATIGTVLKNREQVAQMRFGGRATLVLAETPRMVTIVDEIEAIGTTSANESVSLAPKVTDTVSRVLFEDGDHVRAGQILVELTNAEETAQLSEAQATLEEATTQLHRVENLIQQRLSSQTQVDEQRVRQQTAAARLEGIVARLDDRLIRAPFAGVLGFRNVSPGTLVTPGTVVTTLDDLSIVKLDFSVPENYLSVLHPGQEVIAKTTAYPDRPFKGTVTTIGSRVDPVTRAVSVRAHISNEEDLLRPGMLMTVSLIRSRESAMAIPEQALIPIQDKQYVFVIDPENRAQRIEVEVGRRRPGIAEVLSGLTMTDRVVTEGVMQLRPGIPVVIKGQEPPVQNGSMPGQMAGQGGERRGPRPAPAGGN